MKTDRRSFLGNLLAGAAAIVGAGMVAPKADASEQMPTLMPGERWEIADIDAAEAAHFNAVMAEAPPTFEAMAADCKSRGCYLDWQGADGSPSILTHITPVDGHRIVNGYDFPMIDARADAWRLSLHGEG